MAIYTVAHEVLVDRSKRGLVPLTFKPTSEYLLETHAEKLARTGISDDRLTTPGMLVVSFRVTDDFSQDWYWKGTMSQEEYTTVSKYLQSSAKSTAASTAVSKPAVATPVSSDLSDYAFFASVPKDHCACGILRVTCDYHRP